MVVDTVTLPVPTSVEELQTALEEIEKEVAEKVAILNLTDPEKIRDQKRELVSRLVARIKNEGTMSIEDITTTLRTWWSTQGEGESATIRTI